MHIGSHIGNGVYEIVCFGLKLDKGFRDRAAHSQPNIMSYDHTPPTDDYVMG